MNFLGKKVRIKDLQAGKRERERVTGLGRRTRDKRRESKVESDGGGG